MKLQMNVMTTVRFQELVADLEKKESIIIPFNSKDISLIANIVYRIKGLYYIIQIIGL